METYYFIKDGEMTVFQHEFSDWAFVEVYNNAFNVWLVNLIKDKYNISVRRKDCGKITKLNNEIEHEPAIKQEKAVKLTEWTKEDLEYAWEVEWTEEEWESFVETVEDNFMPDALNDFMYEQREYFLESWLENVEFTWGREDTIKKFTK